MTRLGLGIAAMYTRDFMHIYIVYDKDGVKVVTHLLHLFLFYIFVFIFSFFDAPFSFLLWMRMLLCISNRFADIQPT